MSKLLGFALVQNQDGDVELFAASEDEKESPGALWRRSDKPNEQKWDSLGPDTGVLSGPTVVPNSDERLEAFIVGKDHAIWHAWQDGPGGNWSGWHPLEGPPGQRVTGEPVLARNEDGRLELFVVTDDGTVWHRWQKQAARGPWAAWHSLERPDSSVERLNLAVTQNLDGRLELFGTASDGTVWHRWQTAVNNGWSGWHSLEAPPGQRVTGGPVLARNEDGRLELFVVTDDRTVWHRWQKGAARGPWAAWRSLGGEVVGFDELAVGPHADGRLILFATDRAAGTLWRREQTVPNNGWSPWESIDQPATLGNPGMGSIERPTLASKADGLLELWLRLPATASDVLFRRFQITTERWAAHWIDFLPTGL